MSYQQYLLLYSANFLDMYFMCLVFQTDIYYQDEIQHIYIIFIQLDLLIGKINNIYLVIFLSEFNQYTVKYFVHVLVLTYVI